MGDKIILIDETSPTGYKIANRGDEVPILDENGKVPPVHLRGKAVYVQADEPTDMVENDIWVRI